MNKAKKREKRLDCCWCSKFHFSFESKSHNNNHIQLNLAIGNISTGLMSSRHSFLLLLQVPTVFKQTHNWIIFSAQGRKNYNNIGISFVWFMSLAVFAVVNCYLVADKPIIYRYAFAFKKKKTMKKPFLTQFFAQYFYRLHPKTTDLGIKHTFCVANKLHGS